MMSRCRCVLFFTVISALLCSCMTMELGSKIPDTVIKNSGLNVYTLLNAATVLPLYSYSAYMRIGGRNGFVEFIKDENPNKTVDGLKVNDKITPLFTEKIMVEVGVGYYIPLSDGEFAFIGDINTDEAQFKVLFFFKKYMNYDAGIFMTYTAYKDWLNEIIYPE